jgi:hypothetical protein
LISGECSTFSVRCSHNGRSSYFGSHRRLLSDGVSNTGRRPGTSSQDQNSTTFGTAITQGITGWYRDPDYQIPIPSCYSISQNTVLRKGLNDQNDIGWGRIYSGHISQDFQTVHNVGTAPGVATTAKQMRPPSPTRAPSSSRYSSTKSKTNGNFEMKHSTAASAPNTPSSTEHYSAPKLLDSTPRCKSIGTQPSHPLTTSHQ